jgi:hypothetical protein
VSGPTGFAAGLACTQLFEPSLMVSAASRWPPGVGSARGLAPHVCALPGCTLVICLKAAIWPDPGAPLPGPLPPHLSFPAFLLGCRPYKSLKPSSSSCEASTGRTARVRPERASQGGQTCWARPRGRGAALKSAAVHTILLPPWPSSHTLSRLRLHFDVPFPSCPFPCFPPLFPCFPPLFPCFPPLQRRTRLCSLPWKPRRSCTT